MPAGSERLASSSRSASTSVDSSSERREASPASPSSGTPIVVAGNAEGAGRERMRLQPALVEGVGQLADSGQYRLLRLQRDRFAVGRQPAPGAQIADQIPVQGSDVGPAVSG